MMNNQFLSDLTELGPIHLPAWRGVRIQHMPVVLHDFKSLPDDLWPWAEAIDHLFYLSSAYHGIGYLTIDERVVQSNHVHRRPGLHVDGMGSWGGGGTWASDGMLTVSNITGCAAWRQTFMGQPLSGLDPGDPQEGDCEHLRPQCQADRRIVLKPRTVYRCSPMCVHESLPMGQESRRTFVRLSMPSDRPWPRNCTPNPKVQPGGPIAEPRRTTGPYAYDEQGGSV